MRHRTALVLACTTALAGGAVLLTGGAAVSGHPNTVSTAELAGRFETQKGDPDGRGSAAVFDQSLTTLCVALEWDRIEAPAAAHIHAGPAGQDGPVVVTLFDVTDPDGQWGGCVSADAAIVSEIVEDPQDYYVNLHNPSYPAGAIRGQLSD